ncbi:MAG: hypothetical protein IKT27_04055 [Clostridia bacterium]|nr:hypothetical protein [Clostridia bacterium]
MGEAGDGVAGRTRPPLVGTCIQQLKASAHWQGGTATPGVIGRLRLRVCYFL